MEVGHRVESQFVGDFLAGQVGVEQQFLAACYLQFQVVLGWWIARLILECLSEHLVPHANFAGYSLHAERLVQALVHDLLGVVDLLQRGVVLLVLFQAARV